jgi:hypothetical protein
MVVLDLLETQVVVAVAVAAEVLLLMQEIQ